MNINKRIASLSPAKRALLEQKLKEKIDREQTIPQRTNRESAPLSFSQQRMWFLHQLSPENPAYNRPVNIRLTGKILLEVLEQSLNEIIRRHEILRTSFPIVDGQPVQAIAQTVSLKLNVIDLGERLPKEQEAEVQQLAVIVAQRPFDLAQTPLVRATLLRLSFREHILLLTIHHIVFDGWSMGVLLKELAALYEAFSAGEPSPLPPLPIQYADYAIWQHNRQEEKLTAQLAYWKQQLAGELPILELPTSRPRAQKSTYNGGRESLLLPKKLSDSLKTLSQREGVTLFMTLLAAFQTLLYRYTGQDDIIIGCPIAGRERTETEKVIGPFINTLVWRNRIDGNFTFRELLGRVREVALGAYAHQDIPFEKLVEELRPERILSCNPLFQILFNMRNVPDEAVDIQNLRISHCPLDTGLAMLDLTLEIVDKDESLCCVVYYKTDLFDAATIKRLVNHFQILLEGIVIAPNQRVCELPILTAGERHKILVEWNDTQTDYPFAKCIHQLFEEQVERTPDAVAVVFKNDSLTYRELNHRANQVAHYLRLLGVAPEVLVGICVERSVEMVVGMLGILKAGGAYVPIDPAYPKERLEFMLSDTNISVLLTQERLLNHIPQANIDILCLDTAQAIISQLSEENLATVVNAENLAYIMYTSGSTGTSKGVCVIHRGVVRLVKNTNYANLSATEVFLQLAPISFDASTFEIWGCLLNGAKLVVMPPTKPSLTELGKAIQQYQVTTLWLTAGLFHLMVDEQISALKPLRQLLAGGDVLSVARVQKFKQSLPECQLINGYGPTENTTFTCCYTSEVHSQIEKSVPIGKPISNTEVYVLDSHLKPVPIGIPGELYIGGDGLARCYFNRPGLTKEKFIPNPFSQEPLAQLYKTGDLVRYLPDGNLEFLGRRDNQVKIRGFRIELGEISAVLCQHPQVREAIAQVREDNPTDKYLVAYVVVKQRQQPTASELRRFLQEKLPDYMIPSALVLLDKLPLTPNGKIDRRALPAPNFHTEKENVVSPPTPLEQLLADIWAEILHRESISIHENFFELGGHSLSATRVISRLGQKLSIELPVRRLFEFPTIAELAAQIQGERRCFEQQQIPPLVPVSRNSNLPLSFAQERLWFFEQLQPNTALYNIPQVLQLKGILNQRALQQALEEIVARHEPLRTNFVNVDGTAFQVIGANKSIELPIIDLMQLPLPEKKTQVERLLQQEVSRPFNLCEDLMLRCCLLRLSCSEHILVLVMHHIASDGWSVGILIKELAALYQAFSTGKPSLLPELPIQYADYAIWQRQWLQGEMLQQQLAYWKQQLADIPPVLDLPTDYPRQASQTFNGARQFIVLPPSLTVALKTLSQQQGVTLFMTLLAAFKILLYRHTGQEDIIVGFPVATRNRSEIEGLIGFFINTLVVRTDLSGNPSFLELLLRVRQVALGAYAHQDMPFEKLVEELQPIRDLSRTPLFQIVFNMLNFEVHKLEIPGLSVEALPAYSPKSKFDLSVYVREKNSAIQIAFVYNADLFAPERLGEMLEQFQYLLFQIVENTEAKIWDFSLVTSKAKAILPNRAEQLAAEWVGAIHERFSQQAIRVPQQIAVTDKQIALSYAEIEALSNQLANYLQQHGIESQDVVVIYAHRSAELVLAVLGILKAGAAFAILDSNYPPARAIDCLHKVSPRGLLILEAAGELPQPIEQFVNTLSLACQLLLPKQIAAVPKQLQNYSCEASVVKVKPDDLAYLAFTSGSTGKPKAILGTHRPLTHFLSWYSETFDLKESDRFSMLSGLAHDPLLRDMFAPLWLGATLCIPSPEEMLTPGWLAKWMKQQKISVTHLTPQMARVVSQTTRTAAEEKITSLRYGFVGGDVLTHRDVVRLQALAPNISCVNFYGATETPQAIGYFSVPKLEADAQQTVNFPSAIPVGRGINNVQLLVLNKSMQLAGVGEIGEIYIRTPYLAKGYLDDAAMYAARFITNPFTKKTGDRLFASGDLGRYLPDGNIAFVGRSNEQVKIRGFRIEMGEISAVLCQHPQVREAIAQVREDNSKDKYLVAYVVVKQQQQPTASELRRFLKEKLPDYMIPSAFVLLDKLPLTPNGKIDRRALPAPDSNRQQPEETFVAPRDELERQLTNIWEKVLGREPIGVRDDFFNLGGHSLLAIRLVAAIEETLNKKLPLTALFQLTTIEQLASILRLPEASAPVSATAQQLTASCSQDYPHLQTEDYRTLLAIVAGRKGERLNPNSLMFAIHPNGYKQPLFFCANGFDEIVGIAQHLGEEQPLLFLESGWYVSKNRDRNEYIKALSAHYINEILTVQPEGDYLLGGYCYGGLVIFEIAQQLRSLGKEVKLLAIIDRTGDSAIYRAYIRFEWAVLYNLYQLFSQRGYGNILKFIGQKLEELIQKTILSKFTSSSASKQEYVMRSYPGRVTLFRASAIPRYQHLRFFLFPRAGWKKSIVNDLEVHLVPGDHLSMIREPSVGVLAEKLKACIERVSMI